MTSPVTWRDGVHADRALLQQFQCTDQAKRRFGSDRRRLPKDNLPELAAQGFVRQLSPPAGRGQVITIGSDGDGIVAVAFSQQCDGPWDVFVKVLAVATRARRQGGRIADQLLDTVIDRHMGILLASDNDIDDLVLSGNVDPDNKASAAMCDRNGAEVFDGDGENPFDVWVLTIRRPDF